MCYNIYFFFLARQMLMFPEKKKSLTRQICSFWLVNQTLWKTDLHTFHYTNKEYYFVQNQHITSLLVIHFQYILTECSFLYAWNVKWKEHFIVGYGKPRSVDIMHNMHNAYCNNITNSMVNMLFWNYSLFHYTLNGILDYCILYSIYRQLFKKNKQ